MSILFALSLWGAAEMWIYKKNSGALNQMQALLEGTEVLREQPTIKVLQKWKDALLKEEDFSGYISPFPKMHEVIKWLSCHPLLQDGMDIQQVHCTLEETPLSDPADHSLFSRARVELNVRAAPEKIRLLHAALQQEKTFIDLTKPVECQPQNNHYHLAFFLKNLSFDKETR